LASALTELVNRAEERVFLLLAVLYPEAGMEHIYLGIRDATEALMRRRRANAVELLDNLLDRGVKRKLLPLVEDAPRREKLGAVRELMKLPHPPGAEALAELCRDENPWVRACAIHYASQTRSPSAPDAILAGVADPDSIVRETSLKAALTARPEQARGLAKMRLGDESATVRRLAESIANVAPAA
jgi:hypothetical protein